MHRVHKGGRQPFVDGRARVRQARLKGRQRHAVAAPHAEEEGKQDEPRRTAAPHADVSRHRGRATLWPTPVARLLRRRARQQLRERDARADRLWLRREPLVGLALRRRRRRLCPAALRRQALRQVAPPPGQSAHAAQPRHRRGHRRLRPSARLVHGAEEVLDAPPRQVVRIDVRFGRDPRPNDHEAELDHECEQLTEQIVETTRLGPPLGPRLLESRVVDEELHRASAPLVRHRLDARDHRVALQEVDRLARRPRAVLPPVVRAARADPATARVAPLLAASNSAGLVSTNPKGDRFESHI